MYADTVGVLVENGEELAKDILPPKDCTVVEDSSNGILAAHRAGMQIIAFKNPTSGRQDLHLADIVVERMTDILPLIAASWEGMNE